MEDFGGEDGEMRFGRIESCRIIIIGLGIGGKSRKTGDWKGEVFELYSPEIEFLGTIIIDFDSLFCI